MNKFKLLKNKSYQMEISQQHHIQIQKIHKFLK